MLLSEAAKSGRPFRRKSEPERWYYLSGLQIIERSDGKAMQFNAEQLISNDWEAEPLRISITAQDLLDAARIIHDSNPITHQRRLSPAEYARLFIEQLGLEEGS